MREPGLDRRHRDKTPPKAGEIQQKRSDTVESELEQANPTVPFGCYSRNDARRNWQGE